MMESEDNMLNKNSKKQEAIDVAVPCPLSTIYGLSPFSLIRLLLLKDLSFIFIPRTRDMNQPTPRGSKEYACLKGECSSNNAS